MGYREREYLKRMVLPRWFAHPTMITAAALKMKQFVIIISLI